MAKRNKDNEDQDPDNLNQSDDSADNFGLPDIEYKPLDRTEPIASQPTPEPEEEVKKTYVPQDEIEEPTRERIDYLEDDDEPRSNAPIIIVIMILVVLAGAGFVGWKYWYVPRAEKQRQELAAKAAQELKAKEEQARLAKEQADAEAKKLADEAAAKAKPVDGTIETLAARTNRFYVVIASDIDDDLIMDYAKRLSVKGVSTKIVPPFGTTKFFRLAMGDYDSYASAQSGADAAKPEYGATLWVIKY